MSNPSSEILDLFKPDDYDRNTDKYKQIRIVVVSDTHEDHRMIKIPNGDILLHCGDFTNRHHWFNLSDDEVPQSLIDFNQWLGQLPHRYKIVIGGNHEVNLDKHSQEEIQSKYLTNCIYLQDQLIEIEGISIYGCSWSLEAESKWNLIPSNVDILMTHIPPKSILDSAFQSGKASKAIGSKGHNSIHGVGSKSLLNEIIGRIRPRVHCFGHIHDGFGYTSNKFGVETLFLNAAADISKQCIQLNYYLSHE